MNKAVSPSDLETGAANREPGTSPFVLPLKEAVEVMVQASRIEFPMMVALAVPLPPLPAVSNWASLNLRVTPASTNAFIKAQDDSCLFVNDWVGDDEDLLVFLDEFHTVPYLMPTIEAMVRRKKGETGRKPTPMGGKSYFFRDDIFSLSLIEDFKEIYVSKRDDKGVFRPLTQSAFDKALTKLVKAHEDEMVSVLHLLYSEFVYNPVFGAFLIRVETPYLVENVLDHLFPANVVAMLCLMEKVYQQTLEILNAEDEAIRSIRVDKKLLSTLKSTRSEILKRFGIVVPAQVEDVRPILVEGLQREGFIEHLESSANKSGFTPGGWWTPCRLLVGDLQGEAFDELDFVDTKQSRKAFLEGDCVGAIIAGLTLENANVTAYYLRWMGLRSPIRAARSIALHEHETGIPIRSDAWTFFANKDQMKMLVEQARADLAGEAPAAAQPDTSDLDTIGKRARHARTAAGLSQKPLAEATKVSRSTISWWETDRSKAPPEAIAIMADLYNVSADWIATGETVRAKASGSKSTRKAVGKAAAPVATRGADIPSPALGAAPPAEEAAPVDTGPALDTAAASNTTEAEPTTAATDVPLEAAEAAEVAPEVTGPRLSTAARTLSATWNSTITMLVEKADAARAGVAGITDPEAFLSSLDELRTALMGTSALYAAAIQPVDVSRLLSVAAHIVLESAEIFDEDELIEVPAAGTSHPDDVPVIETEIGVAQQETNNFSQHLKASKEATDEAARLVLTKQAPARDRAASEGALAIQHATLALDAIRRALAFVTPTILAPDVQQATDEAASAAPEDAHVTLSAAEPEIAAPAGYLDVTMTIADKLIDEALQAGDLALATALAAVAMRASMPMESPYSKPLLSFVLLSGSIEQEHWARIKLAALATEAVEHVGMYDPENRATRIAWTMLALAASEGALFNPHSVYTRILAEAQVLPSFAAGIAKIAFALSQVPGKIASRMSPGLIKRAESVSARSPEAVRKDIQDEISGLIATLRSTTINHVPCNQIRAHLVASGLFAQAHKALMAGKRLSADVLAEIEEIEADCSAKLNAIGRAVCGTDDLQGSLRTTLEAKLKSLASLCSRWQASFESDEAVHLHTEISTLSTRFSEACDDLASAAGSDEFGDLGVIMSRWTDRLKTLASGTKGRPDMSVARDAYRAKIPEAAILLECSISDKEAKIMTNMLFDASAF